MTRKRIIIALIVLVAAVAAWAALRGNSKDANQYFTAKTLRGDIRALVEATGTINAVTTVQVGSQVSGTIDRLNADFNSRVKKGQVVARIDPSLFQGSLDQAKADLENARANLASAKANLIKSQATAVQAKADYDRTAALAKEGVLSQQQLDLAQATSESAAAQVSAADAQVKQAAAQVQQKQAAVQVAQTNLDHTIIIAPIDGTVINRSVDIGQTVAASLQAPTLFTIAQDLTKMLVYTKTDESDVGRIRPGQPVTFKVDAFPNETFKGNVQEVRMNATVVQNVVTYDTIIEFDNPDLKLFPGMTAYVTIPVATASDVIKIPNGALRFKPDLKPEELKALYEKYGIQTGGRNNSDTSAANSNGGNGAGSSGDTNGGGTAAQSGRGGQGGGAGRGQGTGQGRGANGGQSGAGNPANFAAAANPAVAGASRPQTAIVWKVLPDKTLQPVQVKTGITDFTYTQLVSGDLKEGEDLVTGSSSKGSAAPRLGQGAPGGGAPRR